MYELAAFWFILVIGTALSLRSRLFHADGNIPTVPSLIPWVGGVLQFSKDSMTYLRQCRERYGSVFRIVLAGRTITVIANAKGVNGIFRDRTKAYNTYLPQLRSVEAIGGVKQSKNAVRIINEKLIPVVIQSFSRDGMDKLGPAFNNDLIRILNSTANEIRSSPDGKMIPLRPFINESIYHAIAAAAFGPLYPFDTYDDFERCDSDFILLITRIPFFSRKAIRSREQIIRAIADYIKRAWSSQLEGVSPMIAEVLSVLRDTDLDEMDLAGTLFTFIWGMQASTKRITHWLMVFLLNNPESAARIRDEIDQEFRDHFDGDIGCLLSTPFTGLEKRFPLVDSAFKETLRMTTVQVAMRQATVDTELVNEIGTLPVRKGDTLMPNIYAIHMNEEVYADPKTFRVDRFLPENRLTHWAFGGGANMCKGRLLAAHVVKTFVVLCFRMFDMELVDASGKSAVGNIPPPDTRRSVSILHPSSKTQLFIRAKLRDLKDGK
ncbi:hypothetical protein NLI96_g10249 [Meripilus lineatus]|uniref:Cytochrome P450 n=1 Tax=Meripilus lineatus TaxID=2056292 RepID=A0AAD5UVH1_9APHY|nr:hypothetical protein NLI96_g10249 [Physisporinus lineatus]